MASKLLSFVGLVTFYVCGGVRGSGQGNFPLENCSAGDMDVMCLYFESGTYKGNIYQQHLCRQFSQDLLSFTSSEAANPVMFADVIDRFSAETENVNVSSWSLHSSLEGEPYGEAELKAKIRRFNGKETVVQKLEFVDLLFAEVGGVRESAIKIAVIFLDGTNLSYEEIKNIPRIVQEKSTGIKIFVVVMGVDFVADTLFMNDTLVVSRAIKVFPEHALTLAVCNRCMKGWWSFDHNGSSADALSCYQLFDFNFTEYENVFKLTCYETHGGTAVAIESEEELHFLQEKLISYFTEFNNNTGDSAGSDPAFDQVYVGLTRDSLSLTSRYKWTWGHPALDRPMVVTNWKPGKPSDGYRKGCAVWQFDWGGLVIGNGNLSALEHGFSNGWTNVECDRVESSLGLCEVESPRKIRSKYLLKINPARKDSFDQALAKGDFVEFEGNIVSISANVADNGFLQFYKQTDQELFPRFDCGLDAGNPRYIAYVYVCDHIDHCSNKRDELACVFDTGDKTTEIMFKENLKRCVGLTCCDGSCLPLQFVNDGEVDCAVCDYSSGNEVDDESVVLNRFLDMNETCAFICDRDVCVHFSQLNNSEVDCYGPEGPMDETVGKLEAAYTCYNKLGLTIWAPRCVYVLDMYGGILGCRDLSHVQNCSEFVCPEGYFKCPSTYCIPQHYVLDGTADCPKGEDEHFGDIEPCTGNFACWDSQICLHPDLVCDEHADCPHGDDEVDCGELCGEGLRCVSATITVSDYNKSIPLPDLSFLDERNKYLDLSGLDLSIVGKEFKYYLVSTRFIKWSDCRITSLPEMLGYYSNWLQELDVSFNPIQTLDGSEVEFLALHNIRLLNVSYNRKLVKVVHLQFPLLEILDLSHTALSRVDESVLAWLPSLTYLDLSYTNIKQFDVYTFPSDYILQILDLRGLYVDNVYENLFNGLTIIHHLYADSFELCCPRVRGANIPGSSCHTIDGSISSCFDLLGVSFQRVLLLVVAFVAVLWNTTVVVYRVFWEKSVLRTGYGLFVTNLGISDFIMGVYLFIIAGADYYYRGVYILYDRIWRESQVCKLSGFLATFSSESSRLFICLITLDRLLVMKFPFGQVRLSSLTKTMCVLASWVTGFTFALTPIVFKFEIYSSNAMCLGLPLSKKRYKGWQFSFCVFIVLNLVLSVIIACGQRAIFRAMSENRTSGTLSSSSVRRAEDMMVAKQLSLVAVFNFLCCVPVGVMGVLSVVGYEISNDVYSWTTVIVLPINSAASPLLYTIPALLAKWEKIKQGNKQPQS